MCTTHYSYAPLLCLPRLPAVWWYIYICTYPPPDPLMQCIFGLHITRQIETWSIHKCGVVPTLYLRALCARAIGTEGGDFGRSVYPISIEGEGGADYAPPKLFPPDFQTFLLPCMHAQIVYLRRWFHCRKLVSNIKGGLSALLLQPYLFWALFPSNLLSLSKKTRSKLLYS